MGEQVGGRFAAYVAVTKFDWQRQEMAGGLGGLQEFGTTPLMAIK